MFLISLGPALDIALANLIIASGAAAQAAIGMGLNLFAVPLLAFIDPVYVPGPVLVHGFLLSCLASFRLRESIKVRELLLQTTQRRRSFDAEFWGSSDALD